MIDDGDDALALQRGLAHEKVVNMSLKLHDAADTIIDNADDDR